MAHTPALHIRLSEADRAALKRLAERLMLSTEADAIRWLIRNADRQQPAPVVAPTVAANDEAEGFD
jgi:hypothetical protein